MLYYFYCHFQVLPPPLPLLIPFSLLLIHVPKLAWDSEVKSISPEYKLEHQKQEHPRRLSQGSRNFTYIPLMMENLACAKCSKCSGGDGDTKSMNAWSLLKQITIL